MLKKVLVTVTIGASALGMMAANAAPSGVYVTGQIGYANTHLKNKTTIHFKDYPDYPYTRNLDNNGLAGRLAIGYQLNKNLAIELGYLKLGNGKYDNIGQKAKSYWYTETLKQSVVDLAAKGILPIADKINAYGKLGVAYVSTNIKTNDFLNPSPSGHSGNDNAFWHIAKHVWAPEAAIGLSYDLTPNVSLDTSWTHIQPVGKKLPGNIDYASVGISYNFG